MTNVTNAPKEFTGVVPARRLDLRGETCPTTSDETLRILEQLNAGEVLEVVSDYYPARSTIPYHCDKRHYRYVFLDADPAGAAPAASGASTWTMRIQKT
ncbi:MAG TPA: sulfurtransferase TusA family protein [Chloroflexota bacterium]|nr:sulfurtransferase TusA family protein [Chloroflexota bacterium]